MANIGTLTANLTLESAAFIRDMEKAQRAVASNTAQMRRHMREIEKATSGVERAFGQMRGAAVALAGALAARQFAQFTQQALDAAGAIADTAAAVGLSTTALQEYRVAAGLSGVATEKFDGALEKFSKTIGDARRGSGALATALGETDRAFLAQLTSAGSTEQALDLMLRRLAETSSAFDRNALAAAAFGRSGVALVNMVAGGAAGLEEMRRQASALGLVLEEDLISQAEEAGDRIDLLKGALATGFNRSVIESFAGAFQLTAENILAARQAGESFGRLVGESMRMAAAAAELVGRHLREIAAAVAAVVAYKAAVVFAGIAVAVQKLVTALLAARAGFVAMGVALAANPIGLVATAIGLAVGALVLFHDKTITVGNTTVQVGRAMAAVWTTIVEGIDVVITAIGYVGSSLTALAEGDLEMLGAVRQAASADVTASIEAIGEAWGDLGPAAETAAAGVTVIGDAVEESADQAATAEDKFGALVAKLEVGRDHARALAEAHREGAAAVDFANVAIEVHNAELQAGVRFTDAQRRALAALIVETRDYNRAIDETVASQREAVKSAEAVAAASKAAAEQAAEAAAAARTRAAEDLGREMERRAAEAERLLQQPFENFLKGVQSATADMFESVFDGGVRTFSDLFDVAKQLAIRFAAEMAALMVFRPQVVNGLGGAAGVAGLQGASGGGLGSLFGGGGFNPLSLLGDVTGRINGIGASLGFAPVPGGFSAPGAFAAGAAGPPASMGGFLGSGATLAGTLGAGALGAFGGAMLASLTGGNSTGGAVGGGLGAALGFALGGPLGGLAGGALGGLAGGLFGPGKSVGPNASATLGVDAGRFLISGSGADNGGSEDAVRREANKAAAFLNQLAESLDLEAVANLPRNVRMLGFGDAARGQRSAEQMVTAILQAGGLTGGSANLQAVLRGSSAATVQENIALLGQIPGLLTPVTSAFDAATKAINDNFDAITAKAQQFGLATDLVAQARERELAAAEAQARAPYLQDAAGIVDFLNAQSLASGSSLNPGQRLAEAQRQFGDLLSRAQGGEAGLGSALAGAAGTLLDLGRQNFASSVSFAGLEGFVRSSLVEVADTLTSDAFFDAQVEATRQQTQVLSGGLGEVEDAIGELKREVVLLRQQLAA